MLHRYDVAMASQWDIFCNIVDNYGDIGVAWRLARQLATEYGIDVRLWVDNLDVFRRIWPEIDPALASQRCQGVEVRVWLDPFPGVVPAQVVIEAFGCRLPEPYLVAMSRLPVHPVWINLEYLSAEPWVRTHHGLPSPHPRLALTKYFFFPGYEPGTGGVLVERDLAQRRDRFVSDESMGFWKRLGVTSPAPDEIRISLFAYENPALGTLLDTWARGNEAVHCLIPEGRILPEVRQWLNESTLPSGASYRRGHLKLWILPFLDQEDYDRLLWVCDLNLVRGEDSCVRAQWAARPLLWQAYPQADDVHRAKLEALLDRYTEGLDPESAKALAGLWRAWNGYGRKEDIAPAWKILRANWNRLEAHARKSCERLTRAGSLADKLVRFVESKLKCPVL